MELLLILSAMLSAVTGAFSGTRGPDGRIPEAETSIGARLAVAVAEEVAAEPQDRPVRELPQAREVLPLEDFALPEPFPLYADRLIE